MARAREICPARTALVGMIAGLLVALWAHPGFAAVVAGRIVAVAKDANVDGPSGNRELNTGETVGAGDLIITDRSGLVQLIFTDETRLVVGPNSKLLIEAYLLQTETKLSRFSAQALGGSFRFITGKSNKNAYAIRTPTGTIGVRGTVFDLFVAASGATDLALLSGGAELCAGTSCLDMNGACDLATVSRSHGPERIGSALHRTRRLDERFRFINSQAALEPAFRVDTSACRATVSSDP
jgi:hypothetical protein